MKSRFFCAVQGLGMLRAVILQNHRVANTYLTVPYKDKDATKGFGARWDAAQRQWFVPESRELAPFSSWLPAGSAVGSGSKEVLSLLGTPGFLALPSNKSISLSRLLAGVSQAAESLGSGFNTVRLTVRPEPVEESGRIRTGLRQSQPERIWHVTEQH